ncbi:MAG: hypothetical protein IPN76_27740 [Saprospiraceae bacterium]|nr:hypothetical protein [Saprospiraceae bacterium]
MKSVFKYQMLLVAIAWCMVALSFGNAAPHPAWYSAATLEATFGQQDPNAQDFTKTIKKEFPLNSNGTVNIVNKYGKVDVKTWDKNRAKVEVTIVVKASSESQAQPVFDRIRIEFANDDSYVKAETVIESTKSNWFDWGGWNEKTEFQINYQVYMPASASIDLTNKYGDALVAPLNGKAKADIKYGNIRLEGANAGLSLVLDYSEGSTVVKSGDANVNISYSKLTMNDVRNVNLTSKYSKLNLENGGDLNAESRYDDMKLGKVNHLQCNTKYGSVAVGSANSIKATAQYSDIKVERLKGNGDFDIAHGGLRIDNVSKGFEKINLLGEHSDFRIGIENGASYTFDANASFAGIAYPDGLVVTYEQEKGSSHQVKGHAGSQNTKGAIKASLNYGGLKVKQ